MLKFRSDELVVLDYDAKLQALMPEAQAIGSAYIGYW